MDKRVFYKIIESPELVNQFNDIQVMVYHLNSNLSRMQDEVLKIVLTEILGREAVPEDGKRLVIGLQDKYPKQWLLRFDGQVIGSMFTSYSYNDDPRYNTFAYRCHFDPTIKTFKHI